MVCFSLFYGWKIPKGECHEKKVITELRKKSEAVCNDISKEIKEHLDDLKTDYEENKKKRLGGDLTPKRLKYRKLIRS